MSSVRCAGRNAVDQIERLDPAVLLRIEHRGDKDARRGIAGRGRIDYRKSLLHIVLPGEETRVIEADPWLLGIGRDRRLEFLVGGRIIAVGRGFLRLVTQLLRLAAAPTLSKRARSAGLIRLFNWSSSAVLFLHPQRIREPQCARPDFRDASAAPRDRSFPPPRPAPLWSRRHPAPSARPTRRGGDAPTAAQDRPRLRIVLRWRRPLGLLDPAPRKWRCRVPGRYPCAGRAPAFSAR